MKQKAEGILGLINALAFSIYLIVDITHFFLLRLNPEYYPLMSGFYENHLLSYLKWGLSAIAILAIYLNTSNKELSLYILLFTIVGILNLFIFKGQWNHFLKGSIVFKIGLLEISAILSTLYLWRIKKKYSVRDCNLIVLAFILFLLITLFTLKIPIACC